MAYIDDCKRRLAEYYASETRIQNAQAYTIKDKELQRTSLTAVQNEIHRLEREIARLEGTKKRCRRVLVRDR